MDSVQYLESQMNWTMVDLGKKQRSNSQGISILLQMRQRIVSLAKDFNHYQR